jgi:hypothetical protein
MSLNCDCLSSYLYLILSLRPPARGRLETGEALLSDRPGNGKQSFYLQSKEYWSEVQDMCRTPLLSSIQRVLKRNTGHVEDTAIILNPKSIEARYRTCGGPRSYPQSKEYWSEVHFIWRTPLLSSIQRVLKRNTGHVEDTALILNPKSI